MDITSNYTPSRAFFCNHSLSEELQRHKAPKLCLERGWEGVLGSAESSVLAEKPNAIPGEGQMDAASGLGLCERHREAWSLVTTWWDYFFVLTEIFLLEQKYLITFNLELIIHVWSD